MAQFARPDSDISTGSWTVTPLWDKVDDSVGTGDADEIASLNNATDVCELGLTAISTPAAGTVTMRWRSRKGSTGGMIISETFKLKEGTTVRATYGPTVIPDSDVFATRSYALTTGERDSITDWGNLSVEITRTHTSSSNRNLRVADFELEAPDAGAATQNVSGTLLGGSTQFTPTVAPGNVATSPGLLGTATIHAPTVLPGSVSTSPGLLGTAVLYAPTFVVGSVAVTPGLLGTSVLFEPSLEIGGYVSLDLLGGAQIFTPVVASSAVTVLTGLLGGATLFEPTTLPGSVSVQISVLLGGATLLTPDVLPGQAVVDAGLLGGSTLFAPGVYPTQSLSIGVLGGSTLFSPSLGLGAVTIVPGILGGATVIAPTGFLSTVNVYGSVSMSVQRRNSVTASHVVIGSASSVVLRGGVTTSINEDA